MGIIYLGECAIGGIIIAVADRAVRIRPIAITAANGMEIAGTTAHRTVEEAVGELHGGRIGPADEAAFVVVAGEQAVINAAVEDYG